MSQTESPHSDIPESSWTNPFGEDTWLHDTYEDRVRLEKDFILLLDDAYGDRGSGKTIGCLKLADGMDQTDEGLTRSKVSLHPEEIRNAYTSEPPRSALVLDEAEWGVSNRQAMSKVNQMLREILSMGRVEQKYLVINTPLIGFIDKDIRKLSHVWISMERRGRGLVHELKWEKYSETLLTPRRQWLNFEDIETGTENRELYNYLTRVKRRINKGDDGRGFIPVSDHEEAIEKAREQARREERNDILRNIYQHPENENSQRVLGEAVGLRQATVSDIINETDEQS